MRLNVLLIGSGGREHALALALKKSPLLAKLYAAPGNPGIGEVAKLIDINANNNAAVVSFCQAEHIDFVVVGPESPLVNGLVDALDAAGIKAFGPCASAAQLEGSKGFTKDLCRSAGIPTAAYSRFSKLEPALAYIVQQGAPIVVKADGLAAGKGVTVAQTLEEAREAISALFHDNSHAEVVIESMLEGEEVSFFALCDGHKVLAFGTAQDHKRVGEGDTGPNTGGMGAYSPAPRIDAAMETTIMQSIIMPTLAAMATRHTPFRGMLFAGIMLTKDGPNLIEYNTRFGDPETQAILPRLQDDLMELLLACADGKLPEGPVHFSSQKAMTVVMAAQNYPYRQKKGGVISGLSQLSDVIVTQAGTVEVDGQITASGGRVLNVTALGDDFDQAAERAYQAIQKVDYADGFYRRDIGWRVRKRI